MQAIGIEHFGEQPRLMDLPVPAPGKGEIEVELHAAAKNPLDDTVAAGYLAGLGEYRFPLVVGFDGAGVIRRVGDDVAGLGVGDRVYGQFWSTPMQFGTYAEVAIVQARPALGALAVIPDGIGFTEAAASPTSGMTAAGALETSGAIAGDTILILGATGGLGTFALQEATARGIHVVASASEQTADALRHLGAQDVLPRDPGALSEQLTPLRAGLAAVLDFAGDPRTTTLAAGALRNRGTLVSTAGSIPGELRNGSRVRTLDYVLDRKVERLATLSTRLTEKTLRPIIGTQLDLPNALTQTAAAPGHLRGKTVISIGI